MMSSLRGWQRHTRHNIAFGVVWLLLMALPILVHAEQFTGKVVGISDGDTISVLREGKAVKIRLYGVDAPEKAQPFGTKARQFTAGLVFQKDVTIVVHATDRYGRLVGEVLLPDGRGLSQELVKAGMAWWYWPYAAKDTTLAQLEAEARAVQRGLWPMRTPSRHGSGAKRSIRHLLRVQERHLALYQPLPMARCTAIGAARCIGYQTARGTRA